MEKRLVIAVTIDDEKRYLDLDTIDRVSVDLTSTVSTYPLVEGDSISDHMYRQPGTITISGTFSTNSRFSTLNYTGLSRLKAIQNLFERIKDERLFVDIMSIYNVRQNYVLQSIQWTEHANTLDYTFSFKQIYTAAVEEVEYKVDVNDPNLPILTEPLQLDLTDTLIDWEEIDKMVIAALKSAKLIDDEFLLGALTIITSDEARTALVVTGVGAALLAKGVIGTAITLGVSIPVAGWIALGVSAIAAGIFALVTWGKKKTEQSKYAIKAFKNYENDRQRQAEVERFVNFLGEIHTQLEVLETAAQVFAITANTNQECVMSIDGDYYIFNFEKNNATGFWSLKITDINGSLISETAQLVGLANMTECSTNNNLFMGKSGTYVYLINMKLGEADIYGDYDNMDYYNDLTNFVFLVTKVDMQEWNTLVSDIISNALKV